MPSIERTIVIDAAGLAYLQWPLAEPDDELDYTIDISAMLSNGDEIQTASIAVAPSGSGEMQIEFGSISGAEITTVLAGGVPGRLYTVLIQATSVDGIIIPLTIYLPIDIQYGIPPFQVAPNPGFGTALIISNVLMELENGAGLWELENSAGQWVWG